MDRRPPFEQAFVSVKNCWGCNETETDNEYSCSSLVTADHDSYDGYLRMEHLVIYAESMAQVKWYGGARQSMNESFIVSKNILILFVDMYPFEYIKKFQRQPPK